jgi:hypothetical protein
VLQCSTKVPATTVSDSFKIRCNDTREEIREKIRSTHLIETTGFAIARAALLLIVSQLTTQAHSRR